MPHWRVELPCILPVVVDTVTTATPQLERSVQGSVETSAPVHVLTVLTSGGGRDRRDLEPRLASLANSGLASGFIWFYSVLQGFL